MLLNQFFTESGIEIEVNEEQFEKERDGISFKIELEAKDTVVSFLQNSKQDVDMFCTVFGIETYVKLLHL